MNALSVRHKKAYDNYTSLENVICIVRYLEEREINSFPPVWRNTKYILSAAPISCILLNSKWSGVLPAFCPGPRFDPIIKCKYAVP